ncbi:MAG: phosphatidylglycerophosphatase A [Acidobacteria bacterium]|nr:phosphatidylglycerophosphatase A [Acidobacteriota bacterium]
MPGTYGSAVGVGLYLLLAALLAPLPHARFLMIAITLVLATLSILVVSIALRSFSVQDPQEIVLDEVVGQLITMLPLPLIAERPGSYWLAIAVSFVLFRAMDTAKPYPVWKLERLPGAWGVVCDDIGAGVAAALVLAAMRWMGWIV